MTKKTIRDEWYERQHKRESATLKEIMRRISKRLFWVVSVKFDRYSEGGYRLVVFLRERN